MHPLKSPLALLAPLAMLLAACNSVRVAPEGQLPKALVQRMASELGMDGPA